MNKNKILVSLGIIIISLTSFNITSADNSIDNLKLELKEINKQIYNSNNNYEIKELKKQSFNKSIELLKKEGKAEIINKKYRIPSEGEWHTYLRTGDIVLFSKGEEWDHALVMYDTNTIFEIYGYGTVSKKSNKSVMLDRLGNYYKHVAVIRMGLNKSQIENMKEYIDKKLGISYGVILPNSVYCSELVYDVHLNSGKKISLDDNGYWTLPSDLLNSINTGSIEYFSY